MDDMNSLEDVAIRVAAKVAASKLTDIFFSGNKRRLANIEAFMRSLESRISSAEQKIDSGVFYELCLTASLAIVKDSRTRKQDVYREILDSSYRGNDEELTSRLYLSITDKLDDVHLVVIDLIRKTPGLDTGREGTDAPAIGFAFIDTHVRNVFPNLPNATNVTTLVLTDLVNSGLVFTRMNKDSSGKMIFGLNPVGLLRMQVVTLSPFGLAYAKFIQESI